MNKWEELKVWNETGLRYRKLLEDEVISLLEHRSYYNSFYEILFEDKSIFVYALDEKSVETLCDLINNALVQPHTSKEIKLNNILNIVDKHNKTDSRVIEEAIKHIYKDYY